ncbi:Sec-independent protein translocase protein TatB [Cognatilysobacter lacus]|uniref:Sec-independent protein translocase protein TatB n=1 Tax=Cognatilysobacter lacus TaxID=1643323 RepID=A0A5D8Z228_9GAMM|nr:Sec-independent protein translocase protein TatB [Lysobacter lacus]TZF88133.1 twin-arginine translocase subunit TatB [Lysobacter lacus]
MFDVGFSELLLTAFVALIVLGPERLPKAARLAGMWIRRARSQWQAVRTELENEIADEDMRRSILGARDDLREAQASLRAQLADVEARMTRAHDAPDPPGQPALTDATPLQAQLADVEASMTAPAPAADTPPIAPHEQR